MIVAVVGGNRESSDQDVVTTLQRRKMEIWKQLHVAALALSVASVVQAETVSQQATTSTEATHTAKQVLYEVTLSVDGKAMNAMSALTDDGVTAQISSTEHMKYRSCASATDCMTKEVTDGLVVSLTPRVAANGSIMTSANIDLSKLIAIATVPEDGFVNEKPVVEQITDDSTFALSSGQMLALPFDVKGRKYLLTIRTKIT